MNIFTFLFQEVLYRPVLNLLVFFYNLPFVDLGIAIIFLTILIRLILWPLNSKAIKNQRDTQIKTQEFQDKMKEIQEKYKNNPNRQNEELTKFWQERKFNPFASLLPMIIQIVVLIALYQALRNILQPEGLNLLYSFVSKPDIINPTFLKFLDLSKTNGVLAVLAGVAQYFSSKINFDLQEKDLKKKKKNQLQHQKYEKNRKKLDPTEEMQKRMQKMMQGQMLYFMPILTIFICFALPAALSLYWCLSSIIGIVQQKMISRKT
ncbi:MAG TPA: YidC/Oxa1 family membrane protein insertase [Candidatus Pacearchaeota archaeon]|nr:YidC/Oxa1 family membrane protein insertase [Candidatus Pacearchaeota archaeon]HOK93978.1 YidC/Oxa1 family membrane protein insertase [Candidatus Pacearchaeota archaeon]HPO75049.1 YidC/Oxa1 family membrane protein insertase [Candidatus Pacearchaeota archaeon]